MIHDIAAEIERRSVPVPWSGCWIWEGAMRPAHYAGRHYGTTVFRGKTTSAHRVSFIAFHGEVPAGQYVCHRCDVTECVNPAHLFAGTPFDNFDDMRRKGRRVQSTIYGERNGSAKLTSAQVQEIRSLKGHMFYRAIAKRYGVGYSLISQIMRGILWKDAYTATGQTGGAL